MQVGAGHARIKAGTGPLANCPPAGSWAIDLCRIDRALPWTQVGPKLAGTRDNQASRDVTSVHGNSNKTGLSGTRRN